MQSHIAARLFLLVLRAERPTLSGVHLSCCTLATALDCSTYFTPHMGYKPQLQSVQLQKLFQKYNQHKV